MAVTTSMQSSSTVDTRRIRRVPWRRVLPLFGSTTTTGLFFVYELGWKSALLVCGVLLFHETGHFVVARRRSVSCALPFLTPFGALVLMKTRPVRARDQLSISIAGPLFGGMFALGLTIVGAATARPNVLSVGLFGLGLNLLQLTPAMPFDGGFIAYSLGEWCPLIGAAVVSVLATVGILPVWIEIFVLVGVMQYLVVRSIDRRSAWRSSTLAARPTAWQFITVCVLACCLAGLALLIDPHSLAWVFT